MTNVQLAEKIGEGHLRECFAVEGEPGLCVKKVKPDLTLFQRLHLLFIRRDLNTAEFNTYKRLPEELKPYFNPVVEVCRDYLITSRPLDYDGSHSRPVSDYGSIANNIFWEEVEKVVALFEKHNMWFFDAFQLGTNVFVQQLSDTHWRPIIIDYKRLGWRSYPIQLNLLLDTEKKKKFYRKYQRFVERFRNGTVSVK